MSYSARQGRLAPGARVLIRDEEWVVRRVDRTSTGNVVVSVMGLSTLVQGREFKFLTELDVVETLDPCDTKLVLDDSQAYSASRLHIESMLRRTPPTDSRIYVGHKAALDPVAYQLVPALHALEQPRPRILIADAVGLGKTLEAGILMSELIRRGRGKRILVVTLKSMLTQFQKELWSRFTIPLVRLDSVGIERVRTKIPSNHNPFYYYDRSIISIDTLKIAREYRTYIESAYWDIIVIDEAQNVADRGTGSLRSRLARLLGRRSDALIMLSATPHDGRPRSFASLINILDATAIANPDSYTKEDFDGKKLFVRRFKKDIKKQVASAFKERETDIIRVKASSEEEQVFSLIATTPSSLLSRRVGSGALLRTVFEKAAFSSPDACRETIANRFKHLKRRSDTQVEDFDVLREIDNALSRVSRQKFSKYQCLKETLRRIGWTGRKKDDRLVIFTERIATLKFLSSALQTDLRLADGAIAQLYGTLSDVAQQDVVEDFGREGSKVRLLVASDIASEGINLHYLCHRVIHFDIPWSLMTLQQRNGRIDRYGQEQTPKIYYLVTKSTNEKVGGDTRILELLIKKEEQAVKNIGDPAAIIGVYNVLDEEKVVTEAIEEGMDETRAEEHLQHTRKGVSGPVPFDPIAALLGDMPVVTVPEAQTATLPSLYSSDYAFLKSCLQHLRAAAHNGQRIDARFYDDDQRIQLTAPADLKERFGDLPRAARPKYDLLDLWQSPLEIMKEMKRCRVEEEAWPQIHYLWPLHPVVDWATDKVAATFGRQEAPVLVLPDVLGPKDIVFVISVLFPNRKGQPVLHKWYAVRTHFGQCRGVDEFKDTAVYRALQSGKLANRGRVHGIDAAQAFLPEALKWADAFIEVERMDFEDEILSKQKKYTRQLQQWIARRTARIEEQFDEADSRALRRKRDELRHVEDIFEDHTEWIAATLELGDKPVSQVIAVLTGKDVA